MSWNVASSFSSHEVPKVGQHWNTDTSDKAYSSLTRLSNLTPALHNPSVMGVVIHRGNYKHFTSKKDMSEKYVLDIIIRDSPEDFIIISCWGHPAFVKNVQQACAIGNIVKIKNVVVQSKPADSAYDKFKPATPNILQLSLYEKLGEVECVEDASIKLLMHIPTKPVMRYSSIYDVSNITTEGSIVDILCVVKEVGMAREFACAKSGRMLHMCEVSLFDDTSNELIFTIWNEGSVQQSQQWKPLQTVIFATDVKATYNGYKRKITVVTTSKTIITEDPDSREAFLLSRYASTVNFDSPCLNYLTGQVLDENALKHVTERRTLKEVQCHIDNNPEELYCIVWANLSCLPIDHNAPHKCVNCHNRTQDCTCEINGNHAHINPYFGLYVSLCDSTASLRHCVMPSCVVQKMLQMPSEDFLQLNQTEKTSLKWKFLLEKSKIILHIDNSSEKQRRVTVLWVSLLYTDEDFLRLISQMKKENRFVVKPKTIRD